MNWKTTLTITFVVVLIPMQANTQGWEHTRATYIDPLNILIVNGSTCRAKDGPAEETILRLQGKIQNFWSRDNVQIFCPLNRRNLHAYSTFAGDRKVVLIRRVLIAVDSPSGNLRCRLFAKDYLSRTINTSFWKTPWAPGRTQMEIVPPLGATAFEWYTVNWGVMCDIPFSESVSRIIAVVENTQSDGLRGG